MPTLHHHIAALKPHLASPETIQAIAQLQAAAFAYAFPDDPPLILEHLTQGLTHTRSDTEGTMFTAHDHTGALVGWTSLSCPTNLHTGVVGVMVHPDARQKGIGRALALEAVRTAHAAGRTHLVCHTGSRGPGGEALARRAGAHPALPMVTSQLRLSEMNDAQLQAWTTRPDGDPFRLHVLGRIPNKHLEQVAQVMNTAPSGDLVQQHQVVTPAMIREQEGGLEADGERRALMAVEHVPTGAFVGYTEVFWMPARATVVYQGSTAIHPDFRGLALGKWLKAAMLLQVRGQVQEAQFVRTANADVNAAMLRINHALGFVPFMTRIEWQGEVASMLTHLEASVT